MVRSFFPLLLRLPRGSEEEFQGKEGKRGWDCDVRSAWTNESERADGRKSLRGLNKMTL
jgi:hypothetical protein